MSEKQKLRTRVIGRLDLQEKLKGVLHHLGCREMTTGGRSIFQERKKKKSRYGEYMGEYKIL